MENYLNEYYNLLINTNDLNVINEFMPTLLLDKTNDMIELLINKINEEKSLAVELECDEYLEHLNAVIKLLKSKQKKEEILDEGILNENVLIFDPNFIKDLRKLDDISLYKETLIAINNLKNKDWYLANKNNIKKYRRLSGAPSGLSEVKEPNIRLLHRPINSDFWYVSSVIKKEGTRKNKTTDELVKIKNDTIDAIDGIIKMYKNESGLDYNSLFNFSEINNTPVMEEVNKWEAKKK